ncbi:MAG: recombinase family protein, partial [bacterium]
SHNDLINPMRFHRTGYPGVRFKKLYVSGSGQMVITDIQNEIGKLNERVAFMMALTAALQKAPTSLNEEIFQKYIEIESAPKVAKIIRDKGIRTKRNTSFQPGDISDIIKNGDSGVDPVLVKMAHEIFNKNTKAVARQYW